MYRAQELNVFGPTECNCKKITLLSTNLASVQKFNLYGSYPVYISLETFVFIASTNLRRTRIVTLMLLTMQLQKHFLVL